MFFTREDILKIQQALLQLGVKDSELPSTEYATYDDTLSIVQDGKNKKIEVKDFFNQISLWKKEDFLNITDKYDEHYISLRDAINLVPILQRKDGLVITFQDTNSDWRIYQFRGNIIEFLNKEKWFDLYDYRNYIVQSIVPDEEDLTASTPDENGNSLVHLKDRIYNPAIFSGKGYKFVRKNIINVELVTVKINVTNPTTLEGDIYFNINNKGTTVHLSPTIHNTTKLVAEAIKDTLTAAYTDYKITVANSVVTLTRKYSGNTSPTTFEMYNTGVRVIVEDSTTIDEKNIITQEDINKADTIYEIRYNFDLDGKIITIPNNCVLYFTSGKFYNGSINMDNTVISTLYEDVLSEVNINGNYYNIQKHIKDHQRQLDDKQAQIDDKQQQITANDEDISLLQTRSTQMEETIKSIAATSGASQATAVTYDNKKSGLTAVNAQAAIDELSIKTNEIFHKNTHEETDCIEFVSEQGEIIGTINNNGANFISLKKKGIEVLTAHQDISGLATKEEVSEKFDKNSIVQESGDAEDKVMSQKIVSDKLSNLSRLTENISRQGNKENKEEVSIISDNGEVIVKVDEGGADFKKITQAGKRVITEEQLELNVSDNDESCIDITDNEGNTVVKVDEGGIKAKNFYDINGNPINKTFFVDRPVDDIKTGAFDSINIPSGYSQYYGKYLDKDHSFKNTTLIICYIYKVTPGEIIHIKGYFQNGIPVTGYFSDENLSNFVSFGDRTGSRDIEYLDYQERVPDGAYYCVLNHVSMEGIYESVRLVTPSLIEAKKHKIVFYGHSIVQMEGYTEELMKLIKKNYPQYDVYNYGIGGEKSVEIMARAGVTKMLLSPSSEYLTEDENTEQKYFVLPSDTSKVELGSNCIKNTWNDDSLSLLMQNTTTWETNFQYVYIDGILCKLEGNTIDSSERIVSYTISRKVPANEPHKIYVGTEMINANNVRLDEDDIAIIDIDVNGGWENAKDAVEQVKTFAENLGTLKIIVLSGGYIDDSAEGINRRSVVLEREKLYSKFFGEKYFNIREYLCNQGVNDAIKSGLWNTGEYPTDELDATTPHPNAEDISFLKQGKFAPMYFINPYKVNGNYLDVIHYSRRTYALKDRKIYELLNMLNYLKK